MNKNLKEKIKLALKSGLNLTTTKLGITKPSSKLENVLKKHSKKLIEDFKKELKRKGKEQAKSGKRTKVAKTAKRIPRKTTK